MKNETEMLRQRRAVERFQSLAIEAAGGPPRRRWQAGGPGAAQRERFSGGRDGEAASAQTKGVRVWIKPKKEKR